MIPYQTHKYKLPGATYREVNKHVLAVYKIITRYTKRQPYVRSSYFNKQKIFFTYFWKHTLSKPFKVRVERLKFFEAAIELVRDCRNTPDSKENPNNSNEILHRFFGLTKGKERFVVQIKEEKRSGKKFLMSIFPYK